jgi:transmembrane sensor
MNLREGLREADAAFQSAELPSLSPRRRSAWGAWKLAAIPVLALLLVVVLYPKSIPPGPRGVEVIASEGARLERSAERIKVLWGEVTFIVAKREAGEAPVRVEVSHGVIEVVGTRFTVRQRDDGGDVTLHEGIIRFGSVELTAGQSLSWPLRPRAEVVELPPPPAPEPMTEPRPTSPRKPRLHREPAVIHETDAAWLLDEVEVLRSRGEYGEAVRLLDKGIAGLVSKSTRERFSFELGSILTRQQSDAAAACRHWAKHKADFPKGRYAQQVQSAEEHAKCAR